MPTARVLSYQKVPYPGSKNETHINTEEATMLSLLFPFRKGLQNPGKHQVQAKSVMHPSNNEVLQLPRLHQEKHCQQVEGNASTQHWQNIWSTGPSPGFPSSEETQTHWRAATAYKHDKGLEHLPLKDGWESWNCPASRKDVSRGILSMCINTLSELVELTPDCIHWKKKSQWVPTEIQEISFKIKKNLFPCRCAQVQFA